MRRYYEYAALSSDPHFGGIAGDGLGFGVEGFEHGNQLGDRQQVVVLGVHVDQGEPAAALGDRHQGRQTHYRAEIRALSALTDWTSQMQGFWESRFDGLEDLLKRMDQ